MEGAGDGWVGRTVPAFCRRVHGFRERGGRSERLAIPSAAPGWFPQRSAMERRLLLPLVFLLSGCASVTPRFSQEIASAFARDSMRKLETEHVELYYPAQQHD